MSTLLDMKLLPAGAAIISPISKTFQDDQGEKVAYATILGVRLVLLPHAINTSVFVLKPGVRQVRNSDPG